MRVPNLVLAMLALAAAVANGQELELELVEVASGLTRPITLTHAGDGSGRLFIGQQTGAIVVLSGGGLLPTPFLDLSGQVSGGSEQGLLGLAFHPDYASNGFFYVHYTDTAGDTVVARYQVSAGDPNVADSGSALTVLTQEQPFANHNGGQLAFGPDGHLYIALGDGGSGGDPGDRAQDLTTLLGKILRIDVDGDDFPGDGDRNYAIPPGNPFVGMAGLDEIWAYGLRNPWRFSFDRLTGDLWIGDVGQNEWEEIDFQPAASAGGENYGWDVLEGMHCFEDDPGGDGSCADFLTGGSTLPVLEYANGSDCAVIGGYRYRGLAEPRLSGIYFYADFCSGRIWGALPDCSGGFVTRELHDAPFNITAFAEDEAGELYLTEYANTDNPLSALRRVTVDAASGGPELTPDPAQIDFGSSVVGSSDTVTVAVENTGSGTDNLVVEFLTLTDDVNFSVDPNAGPDPCVGAPLCLAAGEDCTLTVTFEPQREGSFDELLLLPSNSVPAPVSLLGVVPCSGPDSLVLDNTTVSDSQIHTACQSLTAGPNLTVAPTGHLELRAGESIHVVPPFSVQAGGGLELVLDPGLAE